MEKEGIIISRRKLIFGGAVAAVAGGVAEVFNHIDPSPVTQSRQNEATDTSEEDIFVHVGGLRRSKP